MGAPVIKLFRSKATGKEEPFQLVDGEWQPAGGGSLGVAPVPKIPDAGGPPTSVEAALTRESTKEKLDRMRKEREAPVAPTPEGPGPWESAGRGALHYQSLGAADEMAGLGASGVEPTKELLSGGAALAGPVDQASPVDELKGEASGRTAGRGIDAPRMSDAQQGSATFEAERGKYSARDKASNPVAFHGAGIASTIPSLFLGGVGAATLPERAATASIVGGTAGMAQGALSAEPGQREQGAEQGRQAGMALGPLAEVGMTGLRKAGSSIWGWLHNNPDVRMATAAGADVGPVAGLKPGGAIAANRAEAKGRYGVSAGDVAAEKAVGPATDVINERLDATYGPLHDEQQAFFSSSQGQKRVASRPLSEAIDEAGQRFGLSDQLPVPGSEAKAAKFATLAARLVKGETPEAMSLDQVGRSPSMERDFNAEDLMKIKRRFHDAAAPTSEFDNGEKGAFSALEGEVGKMIEQHYPGLHQINQVAAQDIGQAKGGMQALGFPEETKKLNIGKAVPKTNGLGKQGPAPDLNSDLLTMLPPPGEVPRGPAPDLGAGPTPPGRLPPGRPLGGGRTPLPPKLPKQGPPPDLDSERITIPSPPPPAPTPSPQPAPERPAPSPENNLEPHFLQLKRAFLSGDPDAIKASEVFLRNNPEALQLVRDAQGTEAFARLKGAASPGLHVNAGLTGKPHGVASGLTKGATYRLASAKNIPGGAGAAVGQAVTRADVAGLMQMLGLGDQQQETSP